MDQFAAVKIKRKSPDFKNCKVTDDVFERERIFYSFAIRVRYIGKTSKEELREYLWGPEGRMDPDILRDAEFERIELDTEFRIPEEVMNEIRERGKKEEEIYRREVEEERKRTVEHLRKMLEEKERENRTEEALRIKEEIERRENAEIPELRVLVEPVALLAIYAPVEVHHTLLKNEYATREITWKMDTLTGKHDLRCEGCGRVTDKFFLAVDGLSCEACLKECKECSKPMIHAHLCSVCSEPVCDDHVHFCTSCSAPLCSDHTEKCDFCSNEMCPDHVKHCSICNASLCDDHAYHCAVCNAVIGPKHARICESCGREICPDHIHKCDICGKSVCENCSVNIDGSWYCRDHLEVGYGGKLVLPDIRCKTCGIAVSREDALKCDVCGSTLCPDHASRCVVCGKVLCESHVNECSICHRELCDDHSRISELSGKVYCDEHSTICNVCGRVVGIDETHNGVCHACASMKEISRKDAPREIFLKYPYARKGKNWYISRGKNVAYITEVRGLRLAYRIVDGEIVEYRSNPKFK